MVKRTVSEDANFLMAKFIQDNGKMEKCTAKGKWSTPLNNMLEKEHGKRADLMENTDYCLLTVKLDCSYGSIIN